MHGVSVDMNLFQDIQKDDFNFLTKEYEYEFMKKLCFLIRHNNYKKHLEIGVYKSHQNFDKIIVDYKVGVDLTEGYSEATYIDIK